jgi:hypothetical protein
MRHGSIPLIGKENQMSMEFRSELVDRFQFAAALSEGKRVLDIGGQHPMNHDPSHPFGASYRRITQVASQYECFDRDAKPTVKYAGDLNTAQGRDLLASSLEQYRPQVILCMEILEHLNEPHIVMNILAAYLKKERKAAMFLTLPNNGNWILNALNWHQDHNVAFFKSIAMRFVGRSDLGRLAIVMRPCMQKYKWYWWILYLLAFRQPFNWGFLISQQE